MLLPLIGFVLGCLIAFFVPGSINPDYSVYVAIAILAALDSVLGGISANLRKKFSMMVFLTGLFGNAILAAFIIYLGEKLGLDLYVAIVVVFGTRMFQNFGFIRRFYVDKYSNLGKQLTVEELGSDNPS